MHEHKVVAVVGAIAIALAGCASEQPSDIASSPLPSPSPAAKPATSPTAAKPLVARKATTLAAPGKAVTGLIQSTNPEERAKQVQTSISAEQKVPKDPFLALPPVLPRLQPTAQPAAQTATKTEEPLFQPIPQPGGLGAVFEPRSSTVMVTGVVNVGGVLQAIVKLPDETSSRYVRVGQRLAGGTILVKRIDLKTGGEPVVILEEDGIEFSRPVGDKPSQQKTTA